MCLALGTVAAVSLLLAPGVIIARIARLSWPISVAVAPALTYGVIAVAVVPYGALGIPWNCWTALAALVVVGLVMAVAQRALARFRDPAAEARGPHGGPARLVAAGVLVGAALIFWAAFRGIVHWQSIPSTWDAVWHANTVRFILDTGQASPTHMGELRNVETHALLYYPSVFHALTAVFCQLTGAAPTTGYTVYSVAAAVWLFPVGAAVLTWKLTRPLTTIWRTAGASATAAALSASFTSVPYVEFCVAAMPNMAAYGVAAPTMALITSTSRHRDRLPAAILALFGTFSVHLAGGFVVVTLVGAWWLFDALRRPQRSRLADALALAAVVAGTVILLVPQLMAVSQQEGIIAGHSFPTYLSRRQGLMDAIFLHTRHLNDFPIQYGLLALAAIGMGMLLYRKVWWLPALWVWLVIAIVYCSVPFGGPVGEGIQLFTRFFYNDPRRLSAVVTMVLEPMAGIGLYALARLTTVVVKRVADRFTTVPARVWVAVPAVLVLLTTVLGARHYLPRHRWLMGDKYDSVMIDQHDLDAMAYLAKLPGAKTTLIGDSNVDGTAWMYAVADLHPLWTHYDFPVQAGPGYYRYIFWVHAREGIHNPLVVEAIHALNIRYIYTSEPTVRGFKEPEGIRSLEKSDSWVKIFDNVGAQIWEWRGDAAAQSHQSH